MRTHQTERPYHLQLDTNQASLTVEAQINPGGSLTFASMLTGSANTPPSWHYQTFDQPTNEADFEAYVLSNPDGFSRFYRTPGRFEPIFRAMGIGYSTQTIEQEDQSELRSTFEIAPLNHVDEKVDRLLGPNGQQFAYKNVGLYTPVEYAEALSEGQRIISDDSESAVWPAHDRITHEPGERALGPTFIHHRQRIAEELVSKRSPEALSSFMFLDDKLTDSITAAVLTSNEDIEIPTLRRKTVPVEKLFKRYFQTAAQYSLKAYKLSKDDGAESIAHEVSRELQDRLVTATIRLEAMHA